MHLNKIPLTKEVDITILKFFWKISQQGNGFGHLSIVVSRREVESDGLVTTSCYTNWTTLLRVKLVQELTVK